MKYCESIYQTKRRKTREILVGNVGIGGNNPIRIQSMTTSSTRDAEATVAQAKKLVDAGCEIVRVTVQGMKEADTCEQIKNKLIQSGYNVPLVADIHFYPPAAMRVIDFVDKVRINPGNFVDKRATFKTLEYDDASYEMELLKIEEKFAPLIEKCKKLKRAMRIGTNHGSLSDRIMNRYGDSPTGMLESALEFARLCRKYDYHDFLFSMKSSNPQVMIFAYRLLAAEMEKLGWDYPLHLGVTEAGLGEDGRIKSAMGIGSLLLDGIGDTVRVSLTEDPWYEIDPCQRLISFAQDYKGRGVDPFEEKHRDITNIKRRSVVLQKNLPLHRDGSVFLGNIEQLDNESKKSELFKSIGCESQFEKPKITSTSADALVIDPTKWDEKTLKSLYEAGVGLYSSNSTDNDNACPQIPLISLSQAYERKKKSDQHSRFSIQPKNENSIAVRLTDESSSEWKKLIEINPALIFFSPKDNYLHASRQFFEWLNENQLKIPVILNFKYSCSKEDLTIRAAAEYGALFCDGLGDGLWIEASSVNADELRQLSFNILQAARMRIFKTDFISCPSCGRTLFDLQDVTKRIKSRTAHLAGVKIAIMGCIVNGPGEMADADFGYVGSKPGMIDLYVGKECVEKDISFAEADDRLIELIKTHGRWVE